MRKPGRFAVAFLTFMALPLCAADLRSLKTTGELRAMWPKSAALRVVNVWATWCAPCVAEMPDLRAIDAAFGDEVAITGVSLDNLMPDGTPGKVAAFLDKQNITFPNVYWSGAPDELAEYFDFSGEVPVTIVYDRNGKEVWRHQGRIDREKTIAQLRGRLRRK